MGATRSTVLDASPCAALEALIAAGASHGLSRTDVLLGVLILVYETVATSCAVLAVILPAKTIRTWLALDASCGLAVAEVRR